VRIPVSNADKSFPDEVQETKAAEQTGAGDAVTRAPDPMPWNKAERKYGRQPRQRFEQHADKEGLGYSRSRILMVRPWKDNTQLP
jgi:hypothetical protein